MPDLVITLAGVLILSRETNLNKLGYLQLASSRLSMLSVICGNIGDAVGICF